tara:strand:- start:257 stop:421 length:165 start_codon:yes stop_codon:yes gene_type:complete
LGFGTNSIHYSAEVDSPEVDILGEQAYAVEEVQSLEVPELELLLVSVQMSLDQL